MPLARGRKSLRKFDFFSFNVYNEKRASDDETKKHSRTSPEIQFKELKEKLRITLPDQQINSTMPAKTQTKSSQKIEKQTNKINKYIIIGKILKLLARQNLIPLNIPISKISSKPNFVSEIYAVLYLQGLKNFIGP